MSFKNDGVVVLLGAGASKEAGIPTSIDMIRAIENLFKGVDDEYDKAADWVPYRELYNYVKSSIFHGEGIRGEFEGNSSFNIERLVNTLTELVKKERHTIYPFIGSWDKRLIEVAGYDFNKANELREKIDKKLTGWVTPDDYSQANYYRNLVRFKKEYGFPLRVFSLNYDRCLEKNCDGAILELGFDENRRWDWRRFENNDLAVVDIFLYKLHGSINWKRDDEKRLTFSDESGRASTNELIFGTDYKLQYIDPYLFLAYEFRRYTLESQLIITIGYGFGDEHINGIIGQALNNDSKRRILCLIYLDEKNSEREQTERIRIKENLQVKGEDQIGLVNLGAKQFMNQELCIDKLKALLPPEEDTFQQDILGETDLVENNDSALTHDIVG